jgi:hypothetical protein
MDEEKFPQYFRLYQYQFNELLEKNQSGGNERRQGSQGNMMEVHLDVYEHD